MFFTKKTIGIAINQSSIRGVLLQKQGEAHLLEQFASVSLSKDTIKYSLREPNIIEPERFSDALRETVNQIDHRKKRISVSLPDSAGRVLLLDLESHFKSKSEGADLIRWKLKKSFPFPVQEVHLDYLVVEEKTSGEVSVLVSCISSTVLHQYEELMVMAGLEPYQIDFSSFNLFHLFSPRVMLGERNVFISWFENTLSLFIFVSGKLVFFRTKELLGERMDMNRVFREINSSLLVFRDKMPGTSLQEVYCFSGLEDREAMCSLVREATDMDPVQLETNKRIIIQDGKPDPLMLSHYSSAIGAALRGL